jgi:hypothetical protein
MSDFKLKATHAPVKTYKETLAKCARPFGWMVVAEYQPPCTGKNPLRVDAALPDAFNLPRGYWEAKDEKTT